MIVLVVCIVIMNGYVGKGAEVRWGRHVSREAYAVAVVAHAGHGIGPRALRYAMRCGVQAQSTRMARDRANP